MVTVVSKLHTKINTIIKTAFKGGYESQTLRYSLYYTQKKDQLVSAHCALRHYLALDIHCSHVLEDH